MMQNESQDQTISRVTQELGAALRQQVQGKWGAVRTAGRGEDRRHAWRFLQPGENRTYRFLRVTHKAMMQGGNPVPMLLGHLESGRWLDRLNEGPETSLVLRSGGRLEGVGRK